MITTLIYFFGFLFVFMCVAQAPFTVYNLCKKRFTEEQRGPIYNMFHAIADLVFWIFAVLCLVSMLSSVAF